MKNSIKTLPFFKNQNSKLMQAVKIEIDCLENNSSDQLIIEFIIPNKGIISTPLYISPDKSWYYFFIEEVISPISLRCSIKNKEGKLLNTLDGLIKPSRKWIIHLVHHTHTDLGYTSFQEKIFEDYYYYKDILTYCLKTSDYPEYSKFRWTCENTWQVFNFIEKATKKDIDLFFSLVRQSRIELTAFYLNVTELFSFRELLRSFYYLKEIYNKYNVSIEVAMNTDVPGFSWRIPQILSSIGVKYFSTAPNTYRSRLPHNDRIFWWKYKDGSKVLTLVADRFHAYNEGVELGLNGEYNRAFCNLPHYLNELEEEGYPFNTLIVRTLGSWRDNAPPTMEISNFTRRWNKEWEFPKIIISSLKDGLNEVLKTEDNIATYCKAWPNWWEDVYASAAHEVAVNRENKILHEELSFMSCINQFIPKAKIQIDDKKLESCMNKIIMFDEHSFGSEDSVVEPSSTLTKSQWLKKALFTYHANFDLYEILEELKKDKVTRCSGDSSFLIVLNLSNFVRNGDLKVEISSNLSNLNFELIDISNGESVPFIIKQERKAWPYNGGQVKKYIIFHVSELPPLGFKKYKFNIASGAEFGKPSISKKNFKGNFLENHKFKVEVDKSSGYIINLLDKEAQKNLISTDKEFSFNQLIYEQPKNGRDMVTKTRFESLDELIRFNGIIWDVNENRKNRIGKAASTEDFVRTVPELVDIKREENAVYSRIIISFLHPSFEEILTEYLLFNEANYLMINNKFRKKAITQAEAVYFSFPFNSEGFEQFKIGTCGFSYEPELEQMPGSAKDFMNADWVGMKFINNFKICFAQRESYLVQLGGINTGKWLNKLDIKEPNIYVYAINNYWDTGMPIAQGADESVFSFIISSSSMITSNDHFYNFTDSLVRQPLLGFVCDSDSNLNLNLKESRNNFIKFDNDFLRLDDIKISNDGRGIIMILSDISGIFREHYLNILFMEVKAAYKCNFFESIIESLNIKGGYIKFSCKPYETLCLKII